MYIGKLTPCQIREMLKKMFLVEARVEGYYNANLPYILNNTIAKFKVIKTSNSEYIVSKVNNGDIFVFDDCNYIKFKMPNLAPVSFQKNNVVYLNYMRDNFKGYTDYEAEYNQDTQYMVDFINFCDDLIYQYKLNNKIHTETEMVY